MWYNAEGNYFKTENNGNKVLMRVYSLAEDCEGNKWVEKISYRLEPEILKIKEENGKYNFGYEDFFVEPYHTGEAFDEFEVEADKEYESEVDALPASTWHLVCPTRA